MIIDKLENAEFYYGLSKNIEKALKYLQNTDLTTFNCGKHILDNDIIFVSIQDYNTKSISEAKFEAHKEYIDIQFIIKGQEKLGFGNIKDFTPVTKYDKEKDIIFLEGKGSFVTANEKDFLIFTPEDAHMPSLTPHKSSVFVKKAVVKIKVN